MFLLHQRLPNRPAIIATVGCALAGCTRGAPSPKPVNEERTSSNAATDVLSVAAEFAKLSDAELESRIGPEVQGFCSRCHAMPEASEAPREDWRREIQQAFYFHKKSPAGGEPAPDLEAVVAYFERKAIPYADFTAPPLGDSDPGRVRFSKTEVFIADARQAPALAGLTWIGPHKDRPGALLACDMRSGGLYAVSPSGECKVVSAPESHLLANPCHIEPCDLDGDGLTDLVIADLGKIFPADHQEGRVVWFRRTSEAGGYEPIEIGGALARVADVQPGDFDADGDQDLVVAEFGLHERGRILLLANQGNEAGKTRFALCELDPRHGAIHVPVTDLNGDGKLDFIALIGQEHEVVEAFLNRGDGAFEKQRIYTAPNPSWSSSGIQLVDMDADGDLDVLNTNGDGFDRYYLKPYHAARWLENQSELPWTEHHLGNMPGCQRALAGDLDGDGDVDVVAVAMLENDLLERFGKQHFDGICWFEQTTPGKFQRHTLELGECRHASLALADFDGDGDLDFAAGNFIFDEGQRHGPLPHLTIWENVTPKESGDSADGR